MKLKYTLLLISYFLVVSAQSQKIDRISIQVGYDLHFYEMNQINSALANGFLENQLDSEGFNINDGNSFKFNLAYHPTELFDIGIYGGYQFAKKNSTPSFYKMDEYNLPIKECEGRHELRTEAITFGIGNTWYIDNALDFQTKGSYLSRFHFGIELNAGIGFSKIISDLQPPNGVIEPKEYLYFTSQDFHGQVGLKFEYDFTKQPIFSTLGIRGGYQYFVTKTVKDRLDNEWIVQGENPINLDFSGLYFGVYLKFGK
jgi:hypothetical protein